MKNSSLFWILVVMSIDPPYLAIQEIPDSDAELAEIQGYRDLVPAKVNETVLNNFSAGQRMQVSEYT